MLSESKNNGPRTLLRLAILGLIVFLSPVPLAHAAVTEAWVRRYTNHTAQGGAIDRTVKLVRDAAGDIVVIGTTDHASAGPGMLTLVKYSGANGHVLWKKQSATNGTPLAVAVDAGGNPVVTGYFWNGTNLDYSTAKYAGTDGALLWEERYNGPADSDDYAVAVEVDANGDFAVLGYSFNETSVDYYVAKYGAVNGAVVWTKRYNGPANFMYSLRSANLLTMDGQGNVIVTGDSRGTNSSADYYTAKYAAANGALLWEKRYNGPENGADDAAAVAVDSIGNVIVTGSSESGRYGDYYTAKYAAADGALIWEQRYNGPVNSADYAHALVVDASENVIVTGESSGGDQSNYDYYTAKYAAPDGALIWEQRYNGPANELDSPVAIAVDASGDVSVTGISRNASDANATGDVDYYTAKYDAVDGSLLWERRYNGPANGNDEAVAIVADSSGNVIVTGDSYQPAHFDSYTAMYAAADGALLWESRYDGPTGYYDNFAQAVAVDRVGNVVVTGYSTDGTNTAYTAKYSAIDGALLWERRSAGGYGGGFNDRGSQSVAVDSSGNVVIMGLYFNGDNSDGYTAKFAAADGKLLWERRYAGPTNIHDYANAMVVDTHDNVVVTGLSQDAAGRSVDFFTVKYAAADGALLWEKHINGGGHAVGLDSIDNVMVTGFCTDENKGNFYTAKYAAADGALLWEKLYDVAPFDFAVARSVAVDRSGNAIITGDFYTAKYAAADGALLWEKHTDGSGLVVVVDDLGNAVVTGTAHNAGYRTSKYAAADGALLWERSYGSPSAHADDVPSTVVVDSTGNVFVTGIAYNGTGNNPSDLYTAKYAAADGTVLWEKRYNGPANGIEGMGIDLGVFGFTRNSRSLALGPNGMVVITVSSEGNFGLGRLFDFATVVYQELDARRSENQVLDELIALRATVTDRNEGRKLDEAIKHLTKALADDSWTDEIHLDHRHGHRIFHQNKLTIGILCRMIKSRSNHVPDPVLQGFVDRLTQALRLLATVAIDEAITANATSRKVEQARRFLDQGDAAATNADCSQAVESYRHAWARATD